MPPADGGLRVLRLTSQRNPNAIRSMPKHIAQEFTDLNHIAVVPITLKAYTLKLILSRILLPSNICSPPLLFCFLHS